MLLSPLLCGVGDQGWSPAGHVLAGMMTSNPLSRCVWMAFTEKGLSKSSAAFGVGGSVRGDRADVVCEIPQGKCATIEGKGQGKRADLTQPWLCSMQHAAMVSMAACLHH